jgi:pimeloyl-ACP methyl ester carboxylesterase
MQNVGVVEARAKREPRMTKTMTTMPFTKTVRSKDGTAIAFERTGNGAPLILVDGALCYRGVGPSRQLAKHLAPHFTVFTYDRRGRGESGDTPPYAVEREVEDIAAILSEAGGSAYLWGMSSGGVLALEAATRFNGVKKVGLYEVPLVVDNSRAPLQDEWAKIGQAVASHHPSAAVKVFLQGVAGVPNLLIALMRWMPVWSKLEAIAATLPYDGVIMQDYHRGQPLPADQWASVSVPTLVMDGGKSPQWMRNGNRALARVLRNAQYRTLAGHTHVVKAKAHAAALVEFFKG